MVRSRINASPTNFLDFTLGQLTHDSILDELRIIPPGNPSDAESRCLDIGI